MTLGGFFGTVAVNDAGAVAFFASFSGGSGIFIRRPGGDRLVVATGDVISGDTITGFFEHLRLNNSGTVAFSALSSVPVFGFGVYTQHSRVAAIGDTIDGFTLTGLEFTPSLNDRGTVVVAANCACPPGFSGIFTQTRKVAMAGDTFGGVTLTAVGPGPSVNDSGEVALLAGFSGGSGLVSTRSGLLAAIGGVIDGVTLGSIFKPWLNNAGLVAFDGNPFLPSHSVFTQHARIASIGDAVDGKTIAGAPTGFFFPVLNNTGQLVFAADFTDGSQGIVLATRSH